MLAELLELAPAGVEEVSRGDGTVEYAVYGAPGELPALPELTAAAGDALVEVRTAEVADDWPERWRAFHRPLVLGTHLTVRPPWEPRATTELDVVIDPGRAFGTGAHPTTRLCLELLLCLEPDGPLLDLGCGSGVLAITAAKLGFGPVLALDNDPAAIEATAENARVNGVEVEVQRCDLRRDSLPEASTITANLLGPLLLTVADRLAPSHVPSQLVAGGLLHQEAGKVAATFADAGLLERERRSQGEWTSLLLGKLQSFGDAD